MIDIYLIRHGKASSGWDNLNPDLDIIGKKQSNKIATELLNIAKKKLEREREMVKREETINNNNNKENYKLQNNITYIQTCAPAILHTYIFHFLKLQKRKS